MHLVKNNQFEGIAILRHQVASRVIGSNGEWQNLLLAAVIHTYLGCKRIDQPRIPLVQQVNRRSNYHGRAIHTIASLYTDKRFPSPLRQYIAPPPSRSEERRV